MHQAAGIRSIDRAPRAGAPARASAFVIGSGKGGVGKSVLSVLVAAAMARRGRRVLLLDGSQNQGNLHVLLGVRPAAPLEALAAGEVRPEDLVVSLGERLSLVPADSGDEVLHAMGLVERARLHLKLSSLYDAYDVVVVDAGPGLESAVRVATMRASRVAVVTAPEPAALSDAYALMKIVHLQVPGMPMDVLVNRAADASEGPASYERLRTAADRFLGLAVGYLGAVPEDERLRLAVRRPGGLLEAPAAAVADAVDQIAATWTSSTANSEREKADVAG